MENYSIERPINQKEEVERYKDLLEKMQEQWQDAVSKLNNNTAARTISEINQKLKDAQVEVVRLKKENSSLKVQIQLQQSKTFSPVSTSTNRVNPTADQQNVLKLETQVKQLQLSLSDLKEQESKEKQKLIYQIEQMKESAQDKQKSGQQSNLERQLQEAIMQKEEFEAELTLFKNQDRAIREKATQLEQQNNKLQRKIAENEIRQQNQGSEFSDRDSLLAQLHEINLKADEYQDKIQSTLQVNKQLEQQVIKLQHELKGGDGSTEQKQLIVDLKSKLSVLEREIALISQNAQEQQQIIADENRRLKGQLGEVTKLKELQEQHKIELQESWSQIKTLKQELKLQQDFYEKEKPAVQERPQQESNSYKIQSMLNVKNRQVHELEQRLKEMTDERDSAGQMIFSLKQELKIQDETFTLQSRAQTDYHTQFAERQLSDQNKIAELMAKLTQEQGLIHKLKSQLEQQVVNSVADMTAEKVKILETELSKQNQYFELQERRYKDEIDALSEEIKRLRVTAFEKHEQVDEMVRMAMEMKRSNQGLIQEQKRVLKQLQNSENALMQAEVEISQLKQKVGKMAVPTQLDPFQSYTSFPEIKANNKSSISITEGLYNNNGRSSSRVIPLKAQLAGEYEGGVPLESYRKLVRPKSRQTKSQPDLN